MLATDGDRETPLFGIPSILPSLALGKFLYSPAVSFRAIFETVRCVYDSTKQDIVQYESVYPGQGMHRGLHGTVSHGRRCCRFLAS